MKNKLFIFFFAMLLVSCAKPDAYLQYQHIKNENWQKDSVLQFDVPISDTMSMYNIYVNIRNSSEYPYQNMWLFIETLYPDQTSLRDTIEFYLADNRGKWLGTGVGAFFEMPVLYQQNITFTKTGKYRFRVMHAMRDTVLKGVNDVGLRLEKLRK